MTTLRLRKSDLEILAEADSFMMCGSGAISAKQEKAWSSFYERVLKAEMKPRGVKKHGPSVTDALALFRGVLGLRLVIPAGNPGASWYAPLQKRINDSGLTPEHLVEAAKLAADTWKGPIKAESIIRQADVLLSGAGWGSPGAAPQEHHDLEEL